MVASYAARGDIGDYDIYPRLPSSPDVFHEPFLCIFLTYAYKKVEIQSDILLALLLYRFLAGKLADRRPNPNYDPVGKPVERTILNRTSCADLGLQNAIMISEF